MIINDRVAPLLTKYRQWAKATATVSILLLFSLNLFAAPLLESTLPESEDLIRGQLNNQFNYLLLPIKKENVFLSLRLLVNTGSLDEEDHERGYAHFVEHMAFESSKRFSKEEKLQFREQTGMTFGSHQNAFTSFTHTTYHLDIPTNNDNFRRSALSIMRDTADGQLFHPEEIEKVKKVLFEEHRLRMSKEMPVWRQWFEYMDKDGAFSSRYPSGSKVVIESANKELLEDFYRRRYQPGAMTLIVSGNFDPILIEREIKEHFSDMKNASQKMEKRREPIIEMSQESFAASSKNTLSASSLLISQIPKMSFKTVSDFQQRQNQNFLIAIINGRLKQAMSLRKSVV